MKRILESTLVVLAIASFALASSARASLVSYTVNGVAPQQLTAPIAAPADAPWGAAGYPGDTVELQSYTGTFDLTLGTSTQKINSLLWLVNYTYGGTATDPNAWSDVSFDLNATREIHIGTETATLSQTGLLTASWDNDYLGFSGGPTVSLDYQGYHIAITTLATPSTGASNFDGDAPWAQSAQDMYARFVVTTSSNMTSAPEPSSIAALIGLAGLSCGSSMASRRRSKKATSAI